MNIDIVHVAIIAICVMVLAAIGCFKISNHRKKK